MLEAIKFGIGLTIGAFVVAMGVYITLWLIVGIIAIINKLIK